MISYSNSKHWSIRLSDELIIDHLVSLIQTEDFLYDSRSSVCLVEHTADAITFQFEILSLTIRVLETAEDRITLDATVTNRSHVDQRIRCVSPMQYAGDWNAQGMFTVSGNTQVYTYPAERCYGFDGEHSIENNQPLTSFWFSSFHDPDSQRNFLLGIDNAPHGFVKYSVAPLISSREQFRVLQWTCEIDCHSGIRGVRLTPGASLNTGVLHMTWWQGKHEEGRQRFGERLGKEFKRTTSIKIPTGWCSWYAGYETKNTEQECVKNLSAAKEIGGFDFFQIDEGWMKETGMRLFADSDVDQDKFPHGMKWLANAIRDHGMKPGIWIRPFQGWGDGDDVPVWARGSCIDLSHAEALTWLKEMVHRIVHDWGYEYIKLDFMTYDLFRQWGMKFLDSMIAPLKPFDDTITNIGLYRRGLEAIRGGAGDACFLLGCNCLIGPALGLIDGHRIGDDVSASNWDRTYTMGVKSIEPMKFLNHTVWWNDPDCIMLHEPMSEEHIHEWAHHVVRSGGMRIVSSKLYELSDEHISLLKKILSHETKI